MKKFNFIILSFALIGLVSTLQAKAKRYDVKSGIIEYKISGGGSMMGFKIETKGGSKLIFKDWGNIELSEEETTEKNPGGTEKIHTMTKIDKGVIYGVDFKRKVIMKYNSALIGNYAKNDKDMGKVGKDMMKSMGGKKTGTGKVLGYKCEIWEVMGTKTWLYKGVPLKTSANMMGIKHEQEAVKVKFNTSISNSAFKLPDFPVKSMDEMMNEDMKRMQQMEKGKPTHPQTEADMPSQDEIEKASKQINEIMKGLEGVFGQ